MLKINTIYLACLHCALAPNLILLGQVVWSVALEIKHAKTLCT
jgi:hypothetical protein